MAQVSDKGVPGTGPGILKTFKETISSDPEPTVAERRVGKRLITELLSGDPGALTSQVLQGVQQVQGLRKPITRSWETEEEQEPAGGNTAKIDIARGIFDQMVNRPNITRKQIIHSMIKHAQVTHSTAVSYYERLAKEAGLTNTDELTRSNAAQDEMVAGAHGGENPGDVRGNLDAMVPQLPQENPEDEVGEENKEIEHTYPGDPDRQGVIRHVDRAHLVYKRQTPEGTFEELWVYNTGHDMRDELGVRRAILAGTDIPAQKTQSEDGEQSYTLTTMGNAQLLLIKGLEQ